MRAGVLPGPSAGGVRYLGFDISTRYVDYATRRWGHRARFVNGTFTEAQLATLPR
ncbi:hypothetical protein [Micromonospora zhanjiangensis]